MRSVTGIAQHHPVARHPSLAAKARKLPLKQYRDQQACRTSAKDVETFRFQVNSPVIRSDRMAGLMLSE
jgi:hypothetical protein